MRLAKRGAISNSLGSTANLRARREVEVASQAGGIIREVRTEEGDFVKSGQVLCTLDDRDLQIDLELAEQRLAQTKIQLEAANIRTEQAEAKLRNKRSELERNEEALAQGLLADSEVAVQRHEIEDIQHDLRIQRVHGPGEPVQAGRAGGGNPQGPAPDLADVGHRTVRGQGDRARGGTGPVRPGHGQALQGRGILPDVCRRVLARDGLPAGPVRASQPRSALDRSGGKSQWGVSSASARWSTRRREP